MSPFFVICTATELTALFVAEISQLFVLLDEVWKKNDLLVLKSHITNIPTFRMFMKHRYILCSGYALMEHENLRYRLHVVLYNYELPDGVYRAYSNGLRKEGG